MADPLLDLIAGAKREREKPPADTADDGFDFLGACAGLVAKASRKLKGDDKKAAESRVVSTGGIRG